MMPVDTHISERRAWQRREQEYTRQIEDLRTQRQPGQPASVEEQDLKSQREAAQKALHDLAPGLKDIDGLKSQMTQFAQQQARANDGRARSHIAELAKTAGLSTDPKFLASITRYVALEASQNPDADTRYNAGDFAVLTEAFDAIKGQFTSTQQRAGITALAASKQALSRLPSRPAGSVPGGVAFTKPVAGDPASQRLASRERHNAMSRMVDDLPG